MAEAVFKYFTLTPNLADKPTPKAAGAKWWTGKGYGVSNVTDVTGRPLLTYQGPNDKQPILLANRVAQTFDFTVREKLTSGEQTNQRLDNGTAAAVKKLLGGGSDDEFDHIISLELGGSNTPANIHILQGFKSGAANQTDQLANNLALDVVAGRISLLTAWRTISEQKHFVLIEDMVGKNKSEAAGLMKQLAGNLKDYITGKKKAGAGAPVTGLKAQMDQLLKDLAANPLNQKVQTAIVQTQVKSVATQLGVPEEQATQVVGSYLNSYTENKGINVKELNGALNLYIQQILTNSGKNPNLFGVPSDVIINIIGIIQTTSIGLVVGGLILAVIGIFVAGPEAIVGALSGGLLESIGAIFGVSLLTGLGLTSFAVGEALNVAAIGLNMSIKSMYDNRYLLPTQAISALKDGLAIQKGLAAFLPAAPGSEGGTVKPKTTTKKAVPAVTIYKVVAPNGKTYVFKSAADLAAFKKAAGIK